MNAEKKPYRTLFLSTFQLSAFTFGGGYVIVPLMRKKFVEQLHWIEEQEMLDLTALSQSAPGPIAVNASLLVGYHVAGIPGALITVLGTVLPPLIIISVISVFYAAFRDNPIVSLVMLGMQAGVAAVICDVVVTMAKGVLSQKRIIPAVMMVLAFLAAVFLDINLVIILLVCGCVGAVETIWRDKHQKEEQA
ncbi:chromate transporter [uncultured Oscillibacter sp.]|uniref:chromate transporter n=1 Tax=uncultured Oscillibacter sp. TaxID=876091 RepID=UPI00280587EE|nr:chromate transporter [uncultured Oscillibacter sp.]